MESDENVNYFVLVALVFQSTLSVWRATAVLPLRSHHQVNFNPRSPCGERRRLHDPLSVCQFVFQSTLSVWRATGYGGTKAAKPHHFNPRSPCGERPVQVQADSRHILISIHALRVESDAQVALGSLAADDFNPRSPCGERQKPPSEQQL